MSGSGDGAVSADTVSRCLVLLVDQARDLLLQAQHQARDNLEDFVPHKLAALFGLITAGAQLYRSIGVQKKSEAEAVWQKFSDHAAVKEQLEQLQKLETEWDSFLASVDQRLLPAGARPDARPDLDTPFTDARSGKAVTLGQYLEEGQKLLLVPIRFYG